ncbi:MAG TPA: ABC transporter substrate-binding protein [Acetobacteraceae bacterium]|nr:ABC transporter substrate-binding protein [Acetobacteraceae bacterium]
MNRYRWCIVALGPLIGLAASGATPLRAAEPSTLVWAEAAEPATIDPAKVNVNQELTVARNVYDHLTNFELEHPDHLLPALALTWKRDGTDWTFTLRHGVTFQHGQPFTAADVKATIDRDLAIGQGQSYLVSDIKQVTVVDPYTVRITTQQPDVYLAANLSRIEIMSAADIAAHPKDHGEAYFTDHANGTGPYSFVSWTRGEQIILQRNTHWWGHFPDKPFDRVIDRFVTDAATRARGLEGGAYDLANFVPRDEALRIGHLPGFHLVEGNNLWAWPAIYLNNTLAPTSNIDFRDALVKVFDYDAMTQYYQGSSVTPRGPIPDWVPGSPEKDLAPIKQDIAAAKAALDKSGVKNPVMTCSVPSGFAEFAFAGTVLQASAAQIGITVKIEQLPFVQAIDAIKSNHSNCFILGNANLSPVDATKFLAAHYTTGGYYNTAHYDNPAFDKLVAQISSVTDPQQRYDMLKRASQMIIASHSIIWAARPKTDVPVPNHIGGYRIDPAEYINVRLWELYQK